MRLTGPVFPQMSGCDCLQSCDLIGAPRMTEDSKELLSLLNANSVRFLLIGAHALAVSEAIWIRSSTIRLSRTGSSRATIGNSGTAIAAMSYKLNPGFPST